MKFNIILKILFFPFKVIGFIYGFLDNTIFNEFLDGKASGKYFSINTLKAK